MLAVLKDNYYSQLGFAMDSKPKPESREKDMSKYHSNFSTHSCSILHFLISGLKAQVCSMHIPYSINESIYFSNHYPFKLNMILFQSLQCEVFFLVSALYLLWTDHLWIFGVFASLRTSPRTVVTNLHRFINRLINKY